MELKWRQAVLTAASSQGMSYLSLSCSGPRPAAAQGQDPQESLKVSVFLARTSRFFAFSRNNCLVMMAQTTHNGFVCLFVFVSTPMSP